MAQPLNLIKDLFPNRQRQSAQNPTSLQSFDSPRGDQFETPKTEVNHDDNFEDGERLDQSQRYITPSRSLSQRAMIASSVWDRRFPGWRSGIAGYIILASIVLILNISLLAWTATHLDDDYYATVAIGTYAKISNLTDWYHLGAKILSTGLLAGSNYCMQCLSSPTRAEVDAAHARGSYLNIGVLSWRNVMASRKRRMLLLSLLALSSAFLNPIYETSFVMTAALQSYTSALITPSFDVWHPDLPSYLPANFQDHVPSPDYYEYINRIGYMKNIAASDQLWDQTVWENISASDCVDYKLLQPERSTLLVYMKEIPEQMCWHQQSGPSSVVWYTHDLPSNAHFPTYHTNRTSAKCPTAEIPWHSHISYCLSRKAPGRSRLQINIWLLFTATVLNAVNLVCLLLTLKMQKGTPLITTGDAIASFLRVQCSHTAGMCLLSQEELCRKLKENQESLEAAARHSAKKFKMTHSRYYRAVSYGRWSIYTSLFMIVTLMTINGYQTLKETYEITTRDFDARSLWKIGLGNLNENALISTSLCNYLFLDTRSDQWSHCLEAYDVVGAVILSTLPQLSVSAIYLTLNHQLTLMVQLRDWARLARSRQALRVSDPEPASDQVSTYWLSLPYRYSIPLLVTSVSWGWLVSRTFYSVRYILFYEDINVDDVPKVSATLALSGIGLIYSFVFGCVIYGVSLAIGTCKCYPAMPLGPSNSLVIAAACHPPAKDRYAARNLVKWGAIPREENTGNANTPHHCTITSRRVEDPVEGRWYA